MKRLLKAILRLISGPEDWSHLSEQERTALMAGTAKQQRELKRKYRKQKRDSFYSSERYTGPQGAYSGNAAYHDAGAPLNTILADERKSLLEHNQNHPDGR